MSGFEIRPATDDELNEFFQGIKFDLRGTRIVLVDGKVVAFGGFADSDDNTWAFGEVIGDVGRYGARLIRAIKAAMRHSGRDTMMAQFEENPKADALLKCLGFKPSPFSLNGRRVYTWQR